MIFKITNNIYGLQIHIKLFDYNLWIRFHKNFVTTRTLGIRNITQNGIFRVPFFDFDNILYVHLIQELKYLQQRYQLSDMYIFRASQKPNSYHVICLDKLSYKEWIEILNLSSCDQFYKTMPISNDFKTWVLRISKKADSLAPKLIRILKSRYHWRIKNNAHYLFLKYHHNVKYKPFNLDQSYKLYTTEYDTLNYITNKLEKNKSKNI